MADSRQFPPLKSLHSESSLNAAKLAQFEQLQTDALLASLALGQAGCLKTRADGTILDGHHRVWILRTRGVEWTAFRETFSKRSRIQTMSTELHWLRGPWPGKLALAARPRGGDWLNDDISDWKRAGVSSVVSLLTSSEEKDLDLTKEAATIGKQGLEFTAFPIPDRQVPSSEAKLGQVLDNLNTALESGKNVLIHCRQGVGRTGLVAACLLVKNGMSPGSAVETVSAARGVSIPETTEQRDWIERYAPAFTK